MKAGLVGLLSVMLLLLGCVGGGAGGAYDGFQKALAKYKLGNDVYMPATKIDLLGFAADMKRVKELAANDSSKEGKAVALAAELEADFARGLTRSLEGQQLVKVAGIVRPDCSPQGGVKLAQAAFEDAATKVRLALEKKKLLETNYPEQVGRFANIAGNGFNQYAAYLVVTQTAAAKQLEARCK